MYCTRNLPALDLSSGCKAIYCSAECTCMMQYPSFTLYEAMQSCLEAGRQCLALFLPAMRIWPDRHPASVGFVSPLRVGDHLRRISTCKASMISSRQNSPSVTLMQAVGFLGLSRSALHMGFIKEGVDINRLHRQTNIPSIAIS